MPAASIGGCERDIVTGLVPRKQRREPPLSDVSPPVRAAAGPRAAPGKRGWVRPRRGDNSHQRVRIERFGEQASVLRLEVREAPPEVRRIGGGEDDGNRGRL